MRPNDWMVKVDLKDSYFAIPVHAEHRKFLRFWFEEKTFEFNCLPFGLLPAPWVFTKTFETHGSTLTRVRGSFDCIHRRHLSARRVVTAAKNSHCRLNVPYRIPGIRNQPQKVHFGAYTGTGVLRDPSKHGKDGIETTGRKDEEDPPRGREIVRGGACQRQDAVMPTGENECYSTGDPPAPLFCHYLQRCLTQSLDHSNQDYKCVISSDQESIEELHWWSTEMIK